MSVVSCNVDVLRGSTSMVANCVLMLILLKGCFHWLLRKTITILSLEYSCVHNLNDCAKSLWRNESQDGHRFAKNKF